MSIKLPANKASCSTSSGGLLPEMLIVDREYAIDKPSIDRSAKVIEQNGGIKRSQLLYGNGLSSARAHVKAKRPREEGLWGKKAESIIKN